MNFDDDDLDLSEDGEEAEDGEDDLDDGRGAPAKGTTRRGQDQFGGGQGGRGGGGGRVSAGTG